jgi:hypothetical protein
VWIIKRCNIALWLVEYDIYVLLTLKTLVVEANLIGRKNLCAKLCNYLTVNGYKTCEDVIISLTT